MAAALHQAGFSRTRAVFQLWNPRFRPSAARIDGRAPQIFLVSSMQIHSRCAQDLIRDAWTMGDDRPLIVVGGPKAVYEPYHYWSIPGDAGSSAPDVAVTGEVYVLLELLSALVNLRGRTETMREAFERARREGVLESIPGLVYLARGASVREPVVIDTGLQRLVQDLDELPHEATGLSLLEPPHHETGLSPQPLPDSRVRRHAPITSLLMTQGCKFTCSYCPIPAANQKSWRLRSPERLTEEIRTIHERFGIRYFFGSDDNFFNRRETAEQILSAMARSKAAGRPFRSRIRLATEATQFDTYRNRDLLPLARDAGMNAIWFGIEDLTASLINKGQKPAATIELFRLMREQKISPMAMLMFHDGQPFYTRESLYGMSNQVEFLRKAGAVSLQWTSHIPSVGTREYENTYRSGRVIKRVGRYEIPESKIDGNHVLVAGEGAPWKRQLMLLGGYVAFYNPWNFVRALKRDGSPLRRKRIDYQVGGMLVTVWTALRTAPYVFRLMTGRLEYHTTEPLLETVPVRRPPGSFSQLGTPSAGRNGVNGRDQTRRQGPARSGELLERPAGSPH